MSIKQNGGVFGRNPTFNDVTIEGDLIINGEVFTGLDFQGSWNASTNSPSLASSTGTNGEFYIVSVAGTTNLNGITNWGIGDWAIFNGTVWQRVEGGADGNFNDLTANSLTINGTDAVGIDDYILHNGDSNTKFGFSGNDAWKVRTAGVDAVTVDASQNVSIPSGSLSVDAGGSRSNLSNTHVRLTDSYNVEWGGGTNYIRGSNSSNEVVVATNGSNAIVADSSQNVSIPNGDLTLGPNGEGRIRVVNTNNIVIESLTADHSGLQFGTHTIMPYEAGVHSDGDIDLGTTNARFKDAYLSGGVYLGGTGAANKLDDYEEGTFTPVVADAASGGNTGTASTAHGVYTKIGNMVYLSVTLVNVNTSGMNGNQMLYIKSLPFASSTGHAGRAEGSIRSDSLTFAGSITANMDINDSSVRLSDSASGVGDVYLTVAAINSGTTDLFFSIAYQTA